MASGIVPSPLFEIFKANGYDINTISGTAILGIKGPYIDHYEVTEATSICNFHFILQHIKRRAFLGGCITRKLFNPFLAASNEDINKFAADNFKTTSVRNTPQLVFIHLRPPYHYRGPKFDQINVEALMEFKEMEEIWLEQSAENIARLMDVIKGSPRESVVLVFGDHSLSLSREPVDGVPSEFYMQDRYGVIGGVYPKDVCSNFFPSDADQDLVTTLQLVRQLVQCLSDGQDPLPAPYDHLAVWDDLDIPLEPLKFD